MPKSRAIICADCEEPFDSEAPYVKYCLKCRVKHYHPKNQIEIKNCLFCGKEFETTRPWAKFCSPRHKAAYQRQTYEEILKNEQGGTQKKTP